MEFLTPQEHEKLSDRLKKLIGNRITLSTRIAEARAMGDLKENADYHAAREDQAMEESEIKELTKRRKDVKVIDESVQVEDMGFVGATVKLREIDSGDEEIYRLVGDATNDPSLDYYEVTPNSPMGESLMKARVGETIRVDTPHKTLRFEILEIL